MSFGCTGEFVELSKLPVCYTTISFEFALDLLGFTPFFLFSLWTSASNPGHTRYYLIE